MPRTTFALLALGLLALPQLRAAESPLHSAFSFAHGDRVVWLGGTSVERMQEHGYLETWLTAMHPDRHVLHRNLGWSGDTPGGLARAVFGTPEEGFRRLIGDVRMANPTVVVVNYGAVEAHRGQEGLEPFLQDMKHLIGQLEALPARLVLVAPLEAEPLAPPFPDVQPYNANVQLYTDALRKLAQDTGHVFVNLNPIMPLGGRSADGPQLTTNGLHLTDYGYWRLAFEIARTGPPQPDAWQIELDVSERQQNAQQTRLSDINWSDDSVRFVARDARLPFPPPPDNVSAGVSRYSAGTLRVRGLPAGSYQLRVDSEIITTASSEAWAAGVSLPRRGGADQVEQLREAIRQKNELFFHRYRPQNETYLFLFRKHEQGNNAVEVPQFDPLVEKLEQQIAELRVPQKHSYALEAVGSK